MRVESMSSRLDFDERRARALEGVVQYRPGAVAPLQPPTGGGERREPRGPRQSRPSAGIAGGGAAAAAPAAGRRGGGPERPAIGAAPPASDRRAAGADAPASDGRTVGTGRRRRADPDDRRLAEASAEPLGGGRRDRSES